MLIDSAWKLMRTMRTIRPHDGFPDGSTVLRPHPGRRRDKRQLSCNSCRQRKRKCNRQKPCSYCVKHHIQSTCTYVDSESPAISSSYGPMYPLSPATISVEESGTSVRGLGSSATPIDPGPTSADLQLTESATGFKDPTHWTTVLSGMTNASDEGYAQDATQPQATFYSDDSPPSPEQNVLLFEGCKQVSDRELLDSLPERREADSLVALYFRAQEYRSVIHPTEFLKRYNAFWDNPGVAPVSWLGLLYSIFCLTSQVRNDSDESIRSRSSTHSYQILSYRERVVQCLVRSQFAKGGPDIMETLVHYLLIESYLSNDSKVSVWLLMGSIVQIAIRMGYHRDPQHFKSLSPYQGEMRRRMWAMIYSLDIGFSTQMGLPSSIKQSLTDTMPPRNLQDRDFDTASTLTDLPPGRPINELTSSTVIIAKLHVATTIGAISDLVCAPCPLSYEDVVATNLRLHAMMKSLPECCQFRSMSESLLDPPSVIFQRINFYMHYQRARILVSWKFLGTSGSQDIRGIDECWSTVIEAAAEIMRLQHCIAEGIEIFTASRPTGMVDSCFINHGYFLAASIACFLMRHHNDRLSKRARDLLEVRTLLEKSLAIWNGSKDLSREASKVVSAMRVVLGKSTDSEPSLLTPVDTTREISPQAACEDICCRSQMTDRDLSSSGSNFFFDDLPMMMTDASVDATGFPSLPSISMLDCWPLQLEDGGI